jgi:toxin CcdB
MAQFDVHRNSGKHADSIPYVVVVQSALFEEYNRRVVVPLVKASAVGDIANPRFNPTFKIGKTSVVLHPLEIVSVALDKLGKPVASLAAEGNRIIGSLDELLSRGLGLRRPTPPAGITA